MSILDTLLIVTALTAERGVAKRRKADPEDACLVIGDEGRGCLEREPRLP